MRLGEWHRVSATRRISYLAVILSCIWLSLSAPPALADCTPANDLVGTKSVADWVKGGLVYDLTNDVLKTCDGANWNVVGGTGSAEAAGSVAGAVQFNDGSDAFAANDVNLVWDDTNNRLGIGTAAPDGQLHVLSTTTSTARGITYELVTNSGAGPLIVQKKARGTPSAKTAVLANDVVGNLRSEGHDGTAFGSASQIRTIAEQNFTSTNRDAAITFDTTLGTSSSEKMRITGAGNVGIGTTMPNTSALLEVNSTTRGFLPPRLTKAQRDAIVSPPEGLLIYQNQDNRVEWFDGTNWVTFTGTPAAVDLNGASSAKAAKGCKSILDDGHSVGNGTYWLDPDGAGGDAPFQTTCDMTANGGGWTQISLATQWSTSRMNNVAITKEIRFTDSIGTSFLSWTGMLPTNAEFDANLCASAGTRKAGNAYPPATTVATGPHATAFLGAGNDYAKPFACWINHTSNAGCVASWGGRSNFLIGFSSGTYYTNHCGTIPLSSFWIR